MKKIIGKIVNWILVCGLLITMIPVVTKADSTYTRIMPGYTSDLATTIPVCRNIFLTFPILQAFQPIH